MMDYNKKELTRDHLVVKTQEEHQQIEITRKKERERSQAKRLIFLHIVEG